MTPEEVIRFIHDEGVEIIDLKFTDVPGTLQHVGVPPNEVNEALFENGTGFDGSSIRGFQTIDESDMLIVPDASTANLDPVYNIKTLSLLCNIRDPLTGSDYTRDPRNIAQKAEAHLTSTGIGDTSYWGPEAEFFIFDSATFGQDSNSSHHRVDSDEGIWNAGNEYMLDGRTRSQGYRPRHKGGYFPVPPVDTLSDIRSEMVIEMQKFGMKIEKQHHEVATAGQGEIDIVYDTLVKTADNIMIYKYLVKNVAARHGKTATFMPKPLFDDNGTGMHTHQSIWKGDTNIFYGDGYANMSDTMKFYIGGLLTHAPGAPGVRRPDHQLLPPAGAGLRGSREPGLLVPQPQRVLPHSGLLRHPALQAHRVPLPRPDGQPVPRPSARCCSPDSTGSTTRSTPATRWTWTSTTSRPKRPRTYSRCPAASKSR